MDFMADSQRESLDFLDDIKKVIIPQIKTVDTFEDLLYQSKFAGETDFRLKKKK